MTTKPRSKLTAATQRVKIQSIFLRTDLFRKLNRVSNMLETEAKKKPAKRTIFG
jgi:hypothetical protein